MGQQDQEYREEMAEAGGIVLEQQVLEQPVLERAIEQRSQEQPVVGSSPGAPSTSEAAKPSAGPCAICGAEQSAIRINVDGNTLLMESCDNCDIRRWQLEGERIDLQEALNQVGEHSGRRRSKA